MTTMVSAASRRDEELRLGLREVFGFEYDAAVTAGLSALRAEWGAVLPHLRLRALEAKCLAEEAEEMVRAIDTLLPLRSR